MNTVFTSRAVTEGPVPTGLNQSQNSTIQPLQVQPNILENQDDEGSRIDLELEKNLTKIDYEKMKLVQRQRHATDSEGRPYECKDACYRFEPGSHYCTSSSEKSDLTRFGVGVMLYFKFVKHLIFFFVIFAIFSLPALIIFGASFYAYNKDNQNLSYIDLLTSTTIGSLGLGTYSCGVSKYPGAAATTDQKRIFFECPAGIIAGVGEMTFGLIKTGTTCNFVEESDMITSCNIYDNAILNSVFSSCIGESSCNFTVPNSMFVGSGSNSKCDSYYNTRNVYIRVSCSASSLTIFGDVKVAKSTIAFIIATLDALIIIIFLIMIYTLQYAQRSAKFAVMKKAYSASSYTLEIRNLPQKMPAEELASKLWTFLDSKLGPKAIQGGHRIVDVQIVLPNKLIEYNKELGEVIRKKNSLIRQFMQLYAPHYLEPEITFKRLEKTIMIDLKKQNKKDTKSAEAMFNKIKKLTLKKEKLTHEIQRLKTTKDIRTVCAFVTFSSIPARDRIYELFVNSPIERFARILCSCCYSKDISFYGEILRAKSASDPGSILWENLGESIVSVYLRRALSMLLTLVLWAVSGTILIVSTYYKNIFKQNFPTVDCSSKDPTLDEASKDYNLGELQTGLLECYCKADVFGRIDDLFPASGNQALCTEWFKQKVIETSVTFAIVFAVLIINFGVQFVFQALSKFEKHSTLNSELATRVVKTFVAQFLNTGVLILIVNSKINVSFWQGQFRDLTPLWYENVGSTLLSTMFINVFTVPAVQIFSILFGKLMRCCDRGCSCDEKRTKKKTQTAYEDLYTGPEFIVDVRYSQMLTLTFVCFLYSGGMPFLYITTLIQLVMTYYFDKFFLLIFGKLPKNYDEHLESVVRLTLYFILVIHLFFSIFMFGNPQIFDQTTSSISIFTSTVNSITDQFNQNNESIPSKFLRRTTLQHNIILFILLILILGVFLVKGVLLGFLKKTVFAIFSKETDQMKKEGVSSTRNAAQNRVSPDTLPNYTFFHVIKSEDIASLIRLTKVTIKTTGNMELIEHQKRKLALLKQEYLLKRQEEETNQVDPQINFIGFYTYDVRLHPAYKSQFAIEELLDDENLN